MVRSVRRVQLHGRTSTRETACKRRRFKQASLPEQELCLSTHRVGAVTSTNETESSQEDGGTPNTTQAEDSWADERIRQEQTREPGIAFVRDLVELGAQKRTWDVIAPHSRTVKVLWSFWPRLVVQDGILKRRFESLNGEDVVYQVIWPKTLQTELFQLLHARTFGGHFGYKKMAAAVQRRAYWPTWSSDLSTFLKRCEQCARYHRGKLPRQAQLQTPTVGEPLERVSIDITGPHPKSSRGNCYILTVVDHFSKWGEAIPIPNHTAQTVAKALMVHVFSRYGTPNQLLSDREAEFESQLFSQLTSWLGIDKPRTTAYKPSSNGVCERFYRTLNSMSGKVIAKTQRDWDQHLPFVMAAYRATTHDATGFTPNRLFLGREVRMPIDLAMGLPVDDHVNTPNLDEFVVEQQGRAEEAYRIAREHLHKGAQRSKRAYDTRVKPSEFKVGDYVYYYCPRRYSQRSPK